MGPQEQQREGPVGSGEDGIMPPFSGIWQSLPGPGLLNAHCSHTRDSVSQAAPCQARATQREGPFFPAGQSQGFQKSNCNKGS